MSDKKIETRLNIDPDKVMTAEIFVPKWSQLCLLCDDNSREVPHPSCCSYPWICDECREAIVYLKEFKKTLDELRPASNNNFEEPNKNVHPL